MKQRLVSLLVLVCCGCLVGNTAFAQGTAATSLSGTVKDKDGGAVPGATIIVKNNATGVVINTITNGNGNYSVPNVDPGTYTVVISMTGFKKITVEENRILSGQAATVNATLELGAVTDEVTVQGGTELIRTQSPTISSTISGEFIKSVPRSSRNALDFLIFLPGVQTSGGAGNSRSSTISGLPQNTINITIDGVSTSNNLQSGDGFFSMVTPRLDAVEEVTLTTATSGADSAAQGATQVKFVTKSGTNKYKGTGYEYFDHKSLNSNTFFNRLNGLGIPRRTIDTYGGSLGGPIVIPHVVDGRGKAFFFFNEEISWTPNETPRARTIGQPDYLAGNFKYNTASPTTVNVLALAAANGQLATPDPIIDALLKQISAAVATTGNVNTTSTNFLTSTYNYFVAVASTRNSPTTRVDINLSSKHRLTGTYYLQRYKDDPDTLNGAEATFPGLPAHSHQNSYRTTGSSSVKSTLTSNLVNETIFGWQSSPNDFFGDSNPGMFANQGGYAITLGPVTAAFPGTANSPQPRNTPNFNLDDNISWLKGNHNFRFGGSFTRILNNITLSQTVPAISLGFNTTNDPAAGLFNTANFPGASNTDLGNARTLYAMLTGRISSINGTARLNNAGSEYVYLGKGTRAERMDEFGFYAQDSWRWKPNVTLSLGLRYELNMPMVSTTGAYTTSGTDDLCGPSGKGGNNPLGRFCNMFNPGVFNNPGQVPTYVRYTPGTKGYAVDTNNFAPSVGIAYRPNVTNSLGRMILGDPEQAVITAGFTRAFNRERVDRFTGVYASNPGVTTPANRNTAATGFCLVCPGESWPILLRQPERLGPPAFQTTPILPITAATNQNINIFDPNIKTPYTDSWSVALQRSLGKSTAVELRYIGNENKAPWTTEDWNDTNYIENGFLSEFKLAQANLLANVTAGRGTTFAYFGAGTGTAPLPIFLSSFTALPSSAATNPANYTVAAFANSAQFTNSTWIDDLFFGSTDPFGAASNLNTSNSGTWRNNLLATGQPINFWVMNPLVDSANILQNQGGSKYHSLQIDVRRRLSQGLAVQGSYTFARRKSFTNFDLRLPLIERQAGNVPHAVKVLWTYDIPVGRGKRFGTDMNAWLDGVVGGWQFAGAGRIQQPLFRLATNTKLVGMSLEEAQEAFNNIRINVDAITGAVTVWNMPQDIFDNTRLAYNRTPSTPTGYFAGQEPTGRYFAPAIGLDCQSGALGYPLLPGDCSPDMVFHGKWFGEFDFTFQKRFPLGSKATFDFRFEVFNAFMAKNFNQNLNPGSGSTIFRITGTGSGARIGQMIWRINF